MADKLKIDFRVLDLPHAPRIQQEVGASFLIATRKCVLGDTTGLGKTYTTLLAFALSDYFYKTTYGIGMMALVLVRKNAVFKWRDEVYKWFPNKYGVQVIDPGKTPEKRRMLYRFWSLDAPIMVMTYNTFQRDYDAVYAAFMERAKAVPVALVCDEAQVFKSHTSKNYEMVGKLSPHASFAWALTATPYHNHPLEFHGIMSAIDVEYAGGYYWFLETFCNYYLDHFSKEVKVRKSNPIKNVQYYDYVFSRVLAREEIEGMPGVTLDSWYVKPSPEQAQLIFQVESRPKSPFENPMARGAKIQKIIDSPELFHLTMRAPKLDLIDKLIDMLDHRKVVIYSQYLAPLHKIVEYLESKGYPSPHIDGQVSSRERNEVMNRFNTDPSVRAIVIDDAGGDSIDLQAADMLVFYTLPYSNIAYHQVIGRIKRLNSEHDNVEVVMFLCGTSDYRRLEVLGIKNKAVNETKEYADKLGRT